MTERFELTNAVPYTDLARDEGIDTSESVAALGRIAHLRTTGSLCGDASRCGYAQTIIEGQEGYTIIGTCLRMGTQNPDGREACRQRVCAAVAFITGQLTEPGRPDLVTYR